MSEGRAAEVASGPTFSGYVQVDAVPWSQESVDELDPATREPLNESRFVLRRARLRADARTRLVSTTVEVDANTLRGPVVRPVETSISLHTPVPEDRPPLAAVTVGLFKTPFGHEVQESVPARFVLETSTAARALFPGDYDFGARIHGGWRFVRYSVALMNGAPLGERTFPGRDPSESKDVVARLGVDVQATPRVAVYAGASGLLGEGFHAGTPATRDVLSWNDGNEDGLVQLTELQVIAGAPATPSETFERFALGADAGATVTVGSLGSTRIYAELYWAENLDRGLHVADPVAIGRDLRELGWHVGFTQEVTRYALVGVRYDRYEPDRDATDPQGADLIPLSPAYATLAFIAAATYAPLRVTVEYDRNTNPSGRSPDGRPETLASDRVTVRAQVTF